MPSASPAKNEDFRTLLQQEFVARCRRNPKYSIRSFARFLVIDFSTLAKIMNGKRAIGKKTIRRLGEKLDIEPAKLGSLIAGPLRPQADAHYTLIAEETFRIIADWYHYAILELMRLEHFRPNMKWIAKTLSLSQAEVTIAVDRLVRCGFLAIDDAGKWHTY